MAEHTCGRHQPPAPPDGHSPMPLWVVTTSGDGDRCEVAAAFTDYLDARRYAAWWNREETRRYGHLPTGAIATAVAEEIDFYPTDEDPRHRVRDRSLSFDAVTCPDVSRTSSLRAVDCGRLPVIPGGKPGR